MQTKTTLIVVLILVAAVIGGVLIINKVNDKPSKYAPLAQCLADKGVKFYGAFWCPHCQAQEKEFQMSRQALEKTGLYKECSTADGQGTTQICKDAKIESYPTWVFPDGTRLSGETPLKDLAAKGNCALPE